MAIVDQAKDWWEGKAPRERKLLLLLGAALVVCILAWVAMTIRGGLDALEQKNQRTRDALEAIELHRMLAESRAEDTPKVEIPGTPVALDSYLDEILTKVGLKSPTYPTPKEDIKGDLTELSFSISLQGLTINQLEDLLEQVETKNPVVVVTELKVEGNFREEDKLDIDMEVATYYRKGAGTGSGAEGGDAAAAGDDTAEDSDGEGSDS